MIVIPEEFARGTVAREGAAGADWIGELPRIAEELLSRWECVPDGAVTHGAVGLIVPVRCPRPAADGGPTAYPSPPTDPGSPTGPSTPASPDPATPDPAAPAPAPGPTAPAVLKISFPHPGNVHEPDAFALWGGRGAVALYERDDARFAMLLERAGPGSLAELTDSEEVARVAGLLSRRLSVPAPPGLPRLSDHVAPWADELAKEADELEHQLAPRVLDAAAATVRELGPSQPETLVHGDLHARNVLRSEREPWLAIDPKGYVGDPAYDSGALLTSRALPLASADDLGRALHRMLAAFAEAAELDRDRALRWAQLHAVRAAFWGRRHGFHVARDGAERDQIVQLAEYVAGLLTPGAA
ncbi:aminoglycoside phosphotransferase family protein [Streptomyces sp. HSW2009]|uniref:aminoglycoside phosphotransferase family protein n=1 Tax=Streptomyces sp. HSW2009 TaxID=3142890 RepID=UPI0032ED7D5B